MAENMTVYQLLQLQKFQSNRVVVMQRDGKLWCHQCLSARSSERGMQYFVLNAYIQARTPIAPKFHSRGLTIYLLRYSQRNRHLFYSRPLHCSSGRKSYRQRSYFGAFLHTENR